MPDSEHSRWPFDLILFGAMSALWAAVLAGRVIWRELAYFPDESLEGVIAGIKFYGTQAQVVLLCEAAVFASFGLGIAMRRRWALVLAMLYMAEVVFSTLAFMLIYWRDISQTLSVRIAGAQGPAAVLLLLYLWIRSRELIADEG
jgi:hypothetical protein